jgi:hypothetical protein
MIFGHVGGHFDPSRSECVIDIGKYKSDLKKKGKAGQDVKTINKLTIKRIREPTQQVLNGDVGLVCEAFTRGSRAKRPS